MKHAVAALVILLLFGALNVNVIADDEKDALEAVQPEATETAQMAQDLREEETASADDEGQKGPRRDKMAHPERRRKATPTEESTTGAFKGKELVAENTLAHMDFEEDRHRKRIARIERVRELLEEKGNEQAVAQLDKVLEKETARHDRVMKRLRAQDEKAAARFDGILERARNRKGKASKGAAEAAGKGGAKSEKAHTQKKMGKESDEEEDLEASEDASEGKKHTPAGKGKPEGKGKDR